MAEPSYLKYREAYLNISPGTRDNEIKGAYKSQYGKEPDFDDVRKLGFVESLGKGVTTGGYNFLKGLGTLSEYLTGAPSEMEAEYRKKAEASRVPIASITEDPSLAKNPAYWGLGVGEMIPFMASMLGPQAGAYKGAQLLGLTGKAATRFGGLAGGLPGGMIEAMEPYSRARDEGMDPTEARMRGLGAGLAITALNYPTFGALTRKAGPIRKALTTGLTEAGTEYLEEPAQAIAFGEDIGEALKQGLNVVPPAFAMGALTGGLAGIGGRKRRRAKATKQDAIEDLKRLRDQYLPEVDQGVEGDLIKPMKIHDLADKPKAKDGNVDELINLGLSDDLSIETYRAAKMPEAKPFTQEERDILTDKIWDGGYKSDNIYAYTPRNAKFRRPDSYDGYTVSKSRTNDNFEIERDFYDESDTAQSEPVKKIFSFDPTNEQSINTARRKAAWHAYSLSRAEPTETNYRNPEQDNNITRRDPGKWSFEDYQSLPENKGKSQDLLREQHRQKAKAYLNRKDADPDFVENIIERYPNLGHEYYRKRFDNIMHSETPMAEKKVAIDDLLAENESVVDYINKPMEVTEPYDRNLPDNNQFTELDFNFEEEDVAYYHEIITPDQETADVYHYKVTSVGTTRPLNTQEQAMIISLLTTLDNLGVPSDVYKGRINGFVGLAPVEGTIAAHMEYLLDDGRAISVIGIDENLLEKLARFPDNKALVRDAMLALAHEIGHK